MGTTVGHFALFRAGALGIAAIACFAATVSAQNPALTVVSHKRFADGAGNTVVIGEVRNDTTATLYIPRAIVTLDGVEIAQRAEVFTTSPRRLLAGSVFTYALAPTQTGFFRLSIEVPYSPSSSHEVRAEAQQLLTVSGTRTALGVTVSRSGAQYSLTIRNNGTAAVAYNVQSAVGGYVKLGEDNYVLEDVDLVASGGGGSPCATPMLPPGPTSTTLSGAFERPITDMLGRGVALKWDEIFVEPAAFLASGAGGSGFFNVTSACAWTAQSNAPWITILSPTSGTGNGFVEVCAPPNPTAAPRSGTLTIAGLTVRVDQDPGTGTSTSYPDLTPGSAAVQAQHVADLRARIQALRTRFGLKPANWEDDPLSPRATAIRASHITQLRQALNEVYAIARLCAPPYTDATLTSGVTIKAAHIGELRAAVSALE